MHIKTLNWHKYDKERPVSAVPGVIIVSLVLAMLLQIIWHAEQPAPIARATELALPPSETVLRLVSMGDPITLAKLMMFRLQAFDHQPGISIPYSKLDYEKVVTWLERIVQLDPDSQYPLLAAARIYAEVPDDDRKRIMLEFVHAAYLRKPNLQWPAMAHAVFIAKHRLKDLNLALKYARDLRVHTTTAHTYSWVRQMELFVLEDLGEVESARILLGGFLDSGIIKDERELRFLQQRLGVTNTP